MNKVYTLKKEILFKTNIYDILSIAIDKKFNLDEYAIKGQFKINGEYLIKENEKDNFDFTIPYTNYIEEDYDISKISIDIDDFYYEIKDSNKLVINIDIIVNGLEEKERCIDTEEIEDILDLNDITHENIDKVETHEYDKDNYEEYEKEQDENIEKNIVLENIEKIENEYMSKVEEKKEIKIMNDYFTNTNSEFITYKVCIVREGDSIESIIDKYNTSLETLKKYNIINELNIGDKIIIPYEKN